MSFINVIPVLGQESFDYLVYPEQNVFNTQYFYNQAHQLSQALTSFGQSFMQTSRNIYNQINDSETIRLAKAALRYARGVNKPNVILPLTQLEDIRTAQPVMQRYVMAYPDLREYYHQQRVDGYSDTYVDLYPDQKGTDHYDYRRVMQSIIQEDPKDPTQWTAWQFDETLMEGDRELEFYEQVSILKTWDVIAMYLQTGLSDPTDIYGGKVG